MPVPCGKCDPSIRLSAKLESWHSSSPRDCICLKPKWNFKWIPQRILSPALPSLLVNRITVRCTSCPSPCRRGRGLPACLPACLGAGHHNIHWENGISLEEASPTPDFCVSTERNPQSTKLSPLDGRRGEVSSFCVRPAWSRTGPAQQGHNRTCTVPSLPWMSSSDTCRDSAGAVGCSRVSVPSEFLPCLVGSAPLPHMRSSHCTSYLFCRV